MYERCSCRRRSSSRTSGRRSGGRGRSDPADRRSEARAVARRTFDETIDLHQQVSGGAIPEVVEAASLIVESLGAGGKVLAFGNGGSAADAQHCRRAGGSLSAGSERVRRNCALDRHARSVLTSVANDYGFDHVFARQIDALGRAGDVAVAISTSGESPNVTAGVNAARARGLRILALTGRNGTRRRARRRPCERAARLGCPRAGSAQNGHSRHLRDRRDRR